MSIGAALTLPGRYDLICNNVTARMKASSHTYTEDRQAMAYRWDTAASSWLEDDNGQFALTDSDGLGRIDWQGPARARVADVAGLLGASLPGACHCASIYPEGFAFCPDCGQALQQPDFAAPVHADWWGAAIDPFLPRQLPHGLNVTRLPLGERLEQRPAAPAVGRADLSMAPPPNAHCVFAAATFGFAAQRLVALAPKRGVLQYFDPVAQLWHVLVAEDAASTLDFSASDYAWLPALHPSRGEVAIVPTSRGLRRLLINPINETFRTETLFDATLASAPGALRRHIGVLFVGRDGTTRLWSTEADFSQARDYQCAGAPASGWARPIAYDGRLYWLHLEGQLIWQPGQAPQYLPWPAPWQPRLELGAPTQSRDGRLWQLGHDGQAYSFMELGSANPAQEAIDGARLGFANLLFRRGHAVVDEPWSDAQVDDPHEDDSLVLPLLRVLNDHRSQPSGIVLRLHQYTGRAEDALATRVIARATVEWIGRRNVILDDIARLARPRECTAFVYDGTLWLHHPDWNRIRGWRLEDAS
jgi:hypothetical protein